MPNDYQAPAAAVNWSQTINIGYPSQPQPAYERQAAPIYHPTSPVYYPPPQPEPSFYVQQTVAQSSSSCC